MHKNILTAITTAALALIGTTAFAQHIKTTIKFAQPTAGIAADPLNDRIYVVAPSFGGPVDDLAVIDGKKNQVIKNIEIPEGAYLPAVNYFTGKIYIATCDSDVSPVACLVTVVDGSRKDHVSTIPITTTEGDGLLGIAVDVLANKIYVSNASDNVIDIIDGSCDKVVGKIPITGGEPVGLAVNPFLQTLYVPLNDSSVAIFDTRTKSLLSTTTFGGADSFAAVNLLTGNVYVTDAEAGPSTTAALDKDGVVEATIPVGDTPYGLDVDPVTNLVFVASTALNNVTVIKGKTNEVKATVANVSATFVAANFFTQLVYVSGSNGVTVLTEK
jgi:YVTN family beta-propeller protein